MNAIDRIKEIELYAKSIRNNIIDRIDPPARQRVEDIEFLLRCVKVWREVAVDQSISPLARGQSEQVGQAVVDGEFEKWMLLSDEEFEQQRSG